MAEINTDQVIKNIETRDKIKQFISDAYVDFKNALDKDKSLNKLIEKNTGKPGTLHSNLGTWAKKYWFYLVFIGVAILLILKLMDPVPGRKRSHHKWDKNGKLIY